MALNKRLLRKKMVDDLVASADGGEVSIEAIRDVALTLEVSVDTIKRDLKAHGVVSSGRVGFELDLVHRVVIRAYNGNVRAAHDDMVASGMDVPSYRTVAQAVADLPEWQVIDLRKGAAAAKVARQVLSSPGANRCDIVQMDHWFPNIEVIPPGKTSPYKKGVAKPVVTVHIDAATRLILGAAVYYRDPADGDPTRPTPPPAEWVAAATVSATLPRTIDVTPEMGINVDEVVVGGVPKILLADNGLEMLSDEMTLVAMAIGSYYDFSPVKRPETKGVVERVFHTLENGKLTLLPGSTQGPKTHFGTEPFRRDPVLWSVFEEELFAAIDTYNTTAVHSSLRCTPLQAWAKDPTPVDTVDLDLVAGHLSVSRKVSGEEWDRKPQPEGVHFGGTYYQRPGLGPWIGKPHRKVRVAHVVHHNRMPASKGWVYLYGVDRGGEPEPLGIAYHHQHLPPEFAKAILDERIADEQASTQETRQAAEARRSRTTGGGTLQPLAKGLHNPTEPSAPAPAAVPAPAVASSGSVKGGGAVTAARATTRTRPPTDRRRAGQDSLTSRPRNRNVGPTNGVGGNGARGGTSGDGRTDTPKDKL